MYKSSDDPFITETTLDDWRAVLTGQRPQPNHSFIVVAFPNEDVRSEYLRNAKKWPDEEIRCILRTMLGESRDVPIWDDFQLGGLQAVQRARKEGFLDLKPRAWPRFNEHERRLILRKAQKIDIPVWEGLTWVLDLLPQAPNQALSVISAYLFAYVQMLPDLRLVSLADAQSLIRARYIDVGDDEASRLETLAMLPWRDFEFISAAIWRDQGYFVEVTPGAKDRGKDIICVRHGANAERVYIECKNGAHPTPVGVVVQLHGRVARDDVSRGVVVSTAGFTAGPGSAQEFAACNHRISLVDGESLIRLANQYLGHDWPLRLDLIISSERRATKR